MNLFENLQKLNEINNFSELSLSHSDELSILELVKDEYESGYTLYDRLDKETFIEEMDLDYVDGVDNIEEYQQACWNFYIKLHDLGPEGFCKEYKDILNFSEAFIDEYDYDEEDDIVIKNNETEKELLPAQFIRGPKKYPKRIKTDGPKVYFKYKIIVDDKSKEFAVYVYSLSKEDAIDYINETYPNAIIKDMDNIGWLPSIDSGEPIINLTDEKSINE